MSDDFFENKRKIDDFRRQREESIKEQSKERLKEIACKKIKTTMIGAVSSVEKHLSFLWKDDPALRSVFNEMRSDILRKGNDQMRNMEIEVSYYDVIWKRYNSVIPVKNKTGENEDV